MKEGQTLHATVEKEYCPAMQLQQEGKLQGLLIQNMAGHGQAGQHLLATHVHPRCTLLRVKYDTAGLGHWVHQLEARAPRNKVIVAIANKLARIAWSVLFRGEDYRHAALAAA
jgi:hypothetical protein